MQEGGFRLQAPTSASIVVNNILDYDVIKSVKLTLYARVSTHDQSNVQSHETCVLGCKMNGPNNDIRWIDDEQGAHLRLDARRQYTTRLYTVIKVNVQ